LPFLAAFSASFMVNVSNHKDSFFFRGRLLDVFFDGLMFL